MARHGGARGGGEPASSRITMVCRGLGWSADDAASDPATKAPDGSTRARTMTIFHTVRMSPTIVGDGGARVRPG